MKKPSGLWLALLVPIFAQQGLAANFLGFNAGPFYAIVGSTNVPTTPVALQIQFDGPVSSDTFVSLSSSDPSRLAISGGGVTIPAGQSNAIVMVSSIGLGSVTVTGYFEATEATSTVQVVSEIPVVPSLNITPVGGEMRLTWSSNATGYHLETSNDLSNPNSWVVLTSEPTLVDSFFSVTTPINGPKRFYRLRKP